MHISYSAHKPSVSGTSSSNLIQYLDKENQIDNNIDEIKGHESFFNNDYTSIDSDINLNTADIINQLDDNKGSQKLSSSNFYMLNISPSYDEIKHMENLAIEELEKRGFDKLSEGKDKIVFEEQKDELIKMQLKLYTKNLMDEYAISMNREIYVDENKLPNDKEKKDLEQQTNKVFDQYLKEIGIDRPEVKSENKSKEWVELKNITVIDAKEKVSLVEIELDNKNKAQVFIPTKMLQSNDGKIMVPENLYKEKEKEINNKNTLVSLDNYSTSSSKVKINGIEENVIKFEKSDKNFKDKISFSIKEKDLIVTNGNYKINAHLLNEKHTAAIDKNIEKDFGKEKERIYNSLAKSKGFDLSKRPLNGKDLLWFGKVEKTRSYKHTDKSVSHNKEIFSKIKALEKEKIPNISKIELLKKDLIKDKHTNEVVKEGNLKGGNQHHIHVVVSRHDKTMKNPRNKISLSPLANAKDSKMQNGAQVGFDRTTFANKAEKLFDKKFEYNREPNKTFEKYNEKAKSSKIQSESKQFLMKHTGLNLIKQNISPVQTIKNEIGIANIPTKLPTSAKELVLKVAKKIITKGFEY